MWALLFPISYSRLGLMWPLLLKLRQSWGGMAFILPRSAVQASPSIKEAFGDKRVERGELVDLDDHFQQIPGTERMLEADTVWLATGLTPLTELAWIAGCQFDFVPALGGNLPIHNKEMRTTMENIYVAGDIAGVEEASTAMEEGKLAGINAAAALGYLSADEAVKRSDAVWNSLDALRCGYFGQRRKDSKDYMLKKGTEVIG